MENYRLAAMACKCCAASASYVGILDANKCCIDRLGRRALPVSDVQVPYWACGNCGFVFTNYVDEWSAEDFRTKIYNADYEWINPAIPGRADVPLKETPSYANGKRIASFLHGSQDDIRILDFGAGGDPGPLGQGLIDSGFNVSSYEPYRVEEARKPKGRYDVIVAVEVFEHCHDLGALSAFMGRHLSRDGLLWIQTLLHPFPTPPDVLTSWYVAPRDGHVSIFTLPALSCLFNAVGINIVQTAVGTFGFRSVPTFPNRIFLR
ncbi:class I SAM-dependent methyltransferase [Azospirillum lipoferum]|uniref:class I SAM-dependent methyltransferase n=1 Tax=Azospirillum lipoferum TaxID=193 RepID=UPI00366E081F